MEPGRASSLALHRSSSNAVLAPWQTYDWTRFAGSIASRQTKSWLTRSQIVIKHSSNNWTWRKTQLGGGCKALTARYSSWYAAKRVLWLSAWHKASWQVSRQKVSWARFVNQKVWTRSKTFILTWKVQTSQVMLHVSSSRSSWMKHQTWQRASLRTSITPKGRLEWSS